MIPTRRFGWLLLAASLPFALSPILPGAWLAGACAEAILLGASLFEYSALRRTRLTVSPAPALTGPVDSAIAADLVIRSDRTVLARAAVAGPEGIEAHVVAEWFPLPAGRPTDLALSLVPRRRGRHKIGPLYLRTGTALGLLERDRKLPLEIELRAYPSTGDIRRFELLIRRLRLRQMGLRPQRIRGRGMEFEKLREHQPDDEFRQIDWKASARRDMLISRDYQVERSQTIMVLIDAGRMMLEESRGVPKIEYAIQATFLLAHVASRYDDRIGAMAFSDGLDRLVTPAKGKIALSKISEALFDLEAKRVETDYERAFETLDARQRRRALVVLFTNIVDNVVSSLVMGYLTSAARQHLPVCVAVSTDEIRDAARAPASGLDEVYRKSAAKFYLLGRARTLSDLERRGVIVVDAPCGNLRSEVVNKYLDLKARQMI